MDIKKISEAEKVVLYKSANEYQMSGKIKQTCPRCDGKLKYIGNMSSYGIFCKKQCEECCGGDCSKRDNICVMVCGVGNAPHFRNVDEF